MFSEQSIDLPNVLLDGPAPSVFADILQMFPICLIRIKKHSPNEKKRLAKYVVKYCKLDL